MNYKSNDIYGPALKVVAKSLNAEVASLFLIEPEPYLSLRLSATTHSQLNDIVVKVSENPSPRRGHAAAIASGYYFKEAANECRVFTKEELENDIYRSGETSTHLKSGSCISRIVIPLRHNGKKFLGIIIADNKMIDGIPGEFSETDRSYSQAIRELFENIIHQARVTEVFEELRDLLTGHQDLQKLFPTILRHAVILMGADRGDFVAPDQHTSEPIWHSHFGSQPSVTLENCPIGDESFIRHVLSSTKTYEINNEVRNSKWCQQIDKRTQSALVYKFRTPGGNYLP